MNIEQFDYSTDLLSSILWEYNKASNLIGLVNNKQEWYEDNLTAFWQAWETFVFGVLSLPPAALSLDPVTSAFGLSVWSIILNTPLQIGSPPDPTDKPIFGFDWQNPSWTQNQNFWRANFSSGGTEPILTPDQQQLILRLRYFNLTTRGDCFDVNPFLNYVFAGVLGYNELIIFLDGVLNIGENTITGLGTTNSLSVGMSVSGTGIPFNAVITEIINNSTITISSPSTSSGTESLTFTLNKGNVYVLDTLLMKIIYVFRGGLSTTLKYILQQYDALPRQAGVEVKVYSNIGSIFGFEQYNQNFGNGCFIGE